jgi:hypothetical protein
MQIDPPIQAFLNLHPWKYDVLTHCDLRIYYSGDRDANTLRMDLWLGHKEEASWAYEPQQLRLTCYEVDFGSGAYECWTIPAKGRLYLSIEAIGDRHLGRLRYTVKDRELKTLFQCYRFEVRIEETEFEYLLS